MRYLIKIRAVVEIFCGTGMIEWEFKKAFGFAKQCVVEGDEEAEKRMKGLESLVKVFAYCQC